MKFSAGMNRVQYEDTEHFRVTRDFLNRYPSMLKELLSDGDGGGPDSA